MEETVGLSYLQFLKDPLKKSSSEVSYSTVKISSFKISWYLEKELYDEQHAQLDLKQF